ncbi:MAG: NlpC/P60 family protein [Gammaproteobacteria bacterium]
MPPFSSARAFKTLVAIAVLMGLVALNGCSSSTKRHATVAKSSSLFPKNTRQTNTQKRLAKHFSGWERTPYKLGGNSKRGVDCSGFVQITYRDVFSRSIPRTTALLAKRGKNISQKNLKFGDLVFFKTSRKVRHVGIYIGRGKFIHASTSRGVMQSNLGSSYWKKHYWMAKRIPG